jgi:hypothetical protein
MFYKESLHFLYAEPLFYRHKFLDNTYFTRLKIWKICVTYWDTNTVYNLYVWGVQITLSIIYISGGFR